MESKKENKEKKDQKKNNNNPPMKQNTRRLSTGNKLVVSEGDGVKNTFMMMGIEFCIEVLNPYILYLQLM